MKSKRQSQTHSSYPTRASKQLSGQIHQQQSNYFIPNTSKTLKGSKKKTRQHLRTQLLKKSKNTGFHSLDYSTKFLTKSNIKTIDCTPRDIFDLEVSLYQSQHYNTQKQLIEYIQEKRQTSSKQARERIKLFNPPVQSKANIKRILMYKVKPTSQFSNTFISENPELTVRQTLYSKYLTKLQNKQNNINQINKQNHFSSLNLDPRMNQFMNVLIRKTRNQQMDLIGFMLKKQGSEIGSKSENVSNFHVHNCLHNSFLEQKGIYQRSFKNSRMMIQRRKKQKSLNSKQVNLKGKEQTLIINIKQKLQQSTQYRIVVRQ